MRVEFEVRATGDTTVPMVVQQGVNQFVIIPSNSLLTPPGRMERAWSKAWSKVWSGVKKGWKWLTFPLFWWISEAVESAENIYAAPWTSIKKSRAWVDRAKNDLADYQAWTPEERISVRRQQAAWTVTLLTGSIVALCLPGSWALLPLMVVSSAWWLRSHNTRMPWRFDVVRWAMYLPQVPHPKENA